MKAEKNRKFYWLLHAVKDASGKHPKWTIEKIADEIYSSRPKVNETLNNKPGRGAQLRPKLVRFFKKEFPNWPEVFTALGWDEEGRLKSSPGNVPCGTEGGNDG